MRWLRFVSSCFHPFLFLLGTLPAREDNFYVADYGSSSVETVSDTGAVTRLAGNVSGACGVACDVQGKVYTLDINQGRVFCISKVGAASILAQGLSRPEALAFNSHGDLFVTNGNNTISRIFPTGATSTFARGLDDPHGLAFNAAGELFVANHGNNTISRISKSGVVSTFADFTKASSNYQPGTLAFDAHGNLFVTAQSSRAILKVDPAGRFTPFATGVVDPTDIVFDTHGDLYVPSGTSSLIYKINPDGAISVFATGLTRPYGLASNRPLYQPEPEPPIAVPAAGHPPLGLILALAAPALLIVIGFFIFLLKRKVD